MKLTQRTVDGLTPREKEYLAWDDALPGFGIRVKPTGHTAYLIQYRKGNRSRRYTIGACAVFRLDQARRKAQGLLVSARGDGDPASDKAGALRAKTLADLAQRYMLVHAHQKKRPSSVRSDESNLRLHVLPELGTISVKEVARADISRLHHKMRETPGAANRTLALLSKMFNLAEKWDLRVQGSNPCRHVDRYPERSIERYLSDAEMARLGNVLAEAEELGTEHPSVVRAIRLLVFTGARLSEILNLRWDQVDFDRKLIIIPQGKTGRRIIYINPPTLEILASRRQSPRSEWVLPGAKPGQPLVNLRKPWYRLRAKAGLNDVRIHDLRHNFASVAAGGGLSLPVIGRLLGHTQPATTARYAHLAADPLRQANDRVASHLSSAMTAKSESKTRTGKRRADRT